MRTRGAARSWQVWSAGDWLGYSSALQPGTTSGPGSCRCQQVVMGDKALKSRFGIVQEGRTVPKTHAIEWD